MRNHKKPGVRALALWLILAITVCLVGCVNDPIPTEATPTSSPTVAPTTSPTSAPTEEATNLPTVVPTSEPTALPATEHIHAYSEEMVAATCTEGGFTVFTCVCGDSYNGNEVAALGHSYEESVVAPSCTEGGHSVFTCACGDTYQGNDTNATGHQYNEEGVDATCTSDGYVVYTCIVCGSNYTEIIIEAPGHRYEETIIEATTESGGYTEYTCLVCGYSYRDRYTEQLVSFMNVDETVYATETVNVRTGPGSKYDRLGALSRGDSLTRTGIGSNGWSRVIYDGQEAYVHSDYLTTTKPTPENEYPPEGPGGNEEPTGNGNDTNANGEIIYTYPDGTTGTVPQDGATYIDERGIKRVYRVYRDASGRADGDICEYCGKVVEATSHKPRNRIDFCTHSSSNHYCSCCGKWVAAYSCHDCIEYFDGKVFYCNDCGRVSGDGSGGTCAQWLAGGEHICPYCGTTVPDYTCHTCDED